jgi:transaldolase
MMNRGYFHRVSEQTPTRFWINNASSDEAHLAIEAGAVGCTQNPSYTWKMLTHPSQREHATSVLRNIIRETEDNNEAACIAQRTLVAEIARTFMPIYEKSHGRWGYVSIQGDPINEHDPEAIVAEGRKNRAISPNIMIKIPVTVAGLKAMKTLLSENAPINATEVMGVRQAIDVCDIYDEVTQRTGKFPVSYISHITGIYDEYLKRHVEEKGIDISPDILFQAGLAVARKVYWRMKERTSQLGLIGGGARGLHHFTEMVGADACITINWAGTADKLLELDLPVIDRFHSRLSDHVIDVLLEKVVEFKRAFLENGLAMEEYEDFGPVVYFRDIFVKSWTSTLGLIEELRART